MILDKLRITVSGGEARFTYPPITSSTCGDVPPRKVWVVM